MTDIRCSWDRFWVPREGMYRLAPDGFLIDPDGEHGRTANPDVVRYEAISKTPCLALLGEPGIGKTDVLSRVIGNEASASEGSATTTRSLRIDLRSYSEGSRLCNAIFDSTEFRQWINSADTLELHLDSLDECLIHNRTVAALLVDEFAKYPISRLRLRIMCRASEWPALLDEELPRLWGADNFRVYELAPLRRVDVVALAQAHGVQPDQFLAEVSRHDAAPLAMVPITLQLLLRLFRSTGHLAGTRAELYARGCLALCQEFSLSRRSSSAAGIYSPSQRLAIAEYIAAVTIFSRRSMIYLGDDQPPDFQRIAVAVSELADHEDVRDGASIAITADSLAASLRTGLFTSLGPECRIWLHWTFAEFLAARWAATRGLSTHQLRALVFQPDADGSIRVVPQLHETVAWLATMNAELLDDVVRNDPQVLLRSTVAHSDPNTRAKVVDSLLASLDAERITDMDVELRRRYEVLCHDGLSDQLMPFLQSRTRSLMARRAAIDIAEACKATSLADTLVAIAIDRSESAQIRAQAAHAIARIGDAAQRRRLKPLLDTTASEDDDDEIRGNALDALFDQLTGEEFFARIGPPRKPNFIGAYMYFLEYELPERLRIVDLPAALAWVQRREPDVDLAFGFQRIVSSILERAWHNINAAGVLEALAEVVVARLEHHDRPLDARGLNSADLAAEDPERRRLLLSAVAPRVRGEENRYTRAGLSHSGLVLGADVPWLVDQLDAAAPDQKAVWAELIAYTFNSSVPGQYDLVLLAAQRHLELKNVLGWMFATVMLDSPEAASMRADHARQERWRHRKEEEPTTHPPIADLVTRWLDKVDRGDMAAWWRLNLDLTLRPDSDRYPIGSELKADLTSLPAWQEIDAALRERCLPAAERYLYEGDPNNAVWLGTDTFHRPAASGYRALWLLHRLRPEALTRLPDERWALWAPIAVAYPTSLEDDREKVSELLLAMVYQHAPEAVIATVEVMLDKENAAHGLVFVTRRLARCWDTRLVSDLLGIIRTKEDLKPGALREVLSELLSHDGQVVAGFALSVLNGDGPWTDRAMRVAAGVALLGTVPEIHWNELWSLLQADPDLGRELLLKFSHQPGNWLGGSLASHLEESAIADLYLWLTEQFPTSEDPTNDGPLAHFVGERESVGELRDGLLRYLINRGSYSAVAATKRIAASLGDAYPWLKYVVLRADVARRRETWEGVTPDALRRLVRNPRATIVDTEEHLLDAVLQSLSSLARALHGTPAAVRDLWNDNLTPRDEMHLSDYVLRHLVRELGARDGIVANREVQIRRGESTDLLVTVMRRNARTQQFEPLIVVVETKCCWHRDLQSAMQDQLKNRYLLNNGARHGLYLVGWFRCPQWADDYRRDATPKWTLDQAIAFFEQQATELSDANITMRSFVLDASFR